MRFASCVFLLVVSTALFAADKPIEWEYAELTYRTTPGRQAGKDMDGKDGFAVPAALAIHWVTGSHDLSANGWAGLAEKLKAEVKKDVGTESQKIQVLNALGENEWELVNVQIISPTPSVRAGGPPGAVAGGSGATMLFKRSKAIAPLAHLKSQGSDLEKQRTEINRIEEDARLAIRILEEERKKFTSQGAKPPEDVKRNTQRIEDKLEAARRLLDDARNQLKTQAADPTNPEREKAAREREKTAQERQELYLLQKALADAEAAEKKALDQFAVAQSNLNSAKANRAKAEKELESWKPGPSLNSLKLHIRPLLSREKTLTLEIGPVQTVLEGLAAAANETTIKPDETSVWLVRGKELLPVDLAALMQKGDNKTNYKLQNGDQLFVQLNNKK